MLSKFYLQTTDFASNDSNDSHDSNDSNYFNDSKFYLQTTDFASNVRGRRTSS